MTTLLELAKIAPMGDYRNGSYVIGFFDWQFGGSLRFKMAAQGFFGGPLIADPGKATENTSQAYRFQSRQAARQRLQKLQECNAFGQGWEVVNLKKLGTH